MAATGLGAPALVARSKLNPMRMFRRAPRDDLADVVATVVLDDVPGRRAKLLRVVSEAVVLQDEAVAVLGDIRPGAPLDELSRRGGPLARRFLALRDEVPAPADTRMARQCDTAQVVLDHHGKVIIYALELLAADWRSPNIADQLERLDGLGTPAEHLDALYAELAH